MSERSRPTGQNGTTNRSKSADQPDTRVQGTVREPKENRKTKSISTRTTAKRAISADWSLHPDDAIKFADKYPKLSIEDEVEKFQDYHRAKGSKFVDWDAAFRNWCRNAEKFRAQAQGEKSGGWR
jgi:hypothetical protein